MVLHDTYHRNKGGLEGWGRCAKETMVANWDITAVANQVSTSEGE